MLKTQPTTIFYLRVTEGSTIRYYKVRNGKVYLDAQKLPIIDPYNWEELELSIIRNSVYNGIIANDSIPVKFVGDAAVIVRELCIDDTIEAKAELYLERLDTGSGKYFPLVSAGLDFSKIKAMEIGKDKRVLGYEVPVYDGGLYALVDAYKEQKVTISVDDASARKVYAHGSFADTQYQWVGSDQKTDVAVGSNVFIPIKVTSYERSRKGNYLAFSLNESVGAANTGLFDRRLGIASRKQTLTFTGSFNFFYRTDGASTTRGKLRLRLFVYPEGTDLTGTPAARVEQTLWEQASFVNINASTLGTGTISATPIQVFPGEILILAWNGRPEDPSPTKTLGWDFAVQSGWQLYMSTVFQLPASIIKAFDLNTILQKVVSSISDGRYTANSDWAKSTAARVDMRPAAVYLTSGRAVRMGSTGATVKVSLNDLKDIFSSLDMVGMGIHNNQVRAELLSFFFDKDNVIADFTEVASATAPRPYDEAYFTNMEFGYPDVDIREYDNRYEFNSGLSFRTQFTRANGKKLEHKSNATAAFSVIERLRTTLVEREEQDSGSDDNLILLYTTGQLTSVLTDTGLQQAYPLQTGFTILGGVDYPTTAYNMALSPKRCIRRKDRYFKSILYSRNKKNQKLIFQTSGKDTAFSSALSSATGLVREAEDVDYANISAPLLFKPYILEFEACNLPSGTIRELWQKLRTNPYGVIRFSYNGATFEGFILRFSSLQNLTYDFKVTLLASPNVDESQFHVFDYVNPNLTWGGDTSWISGD